MKDQMEGLIVAVHSITNHVPILDRHVDEVEPASYQLNANLSCFDTRLEDVEVTVCYCDAQRKYL